MLLCAAVTSAGMLTLRRGIGMGIKLISESLPTLKLFSKAASLCYETEQQLSVHEGGKLGAVKSAELVLYGKNAERILYDTQLLTDDGRAYVVPKSEQDCIMYLRGAFLACGTCSDPKKSFHLELACRNKTAAEMCREAALILGIGMKLTHRKDSFVLYLKDAETISFFLSVIGADAAVLEFENVRIIRESRNYANRTRNCDVANIDRAYTAAMHQVAEIDYLLKNYGGELPDTLFEAAQMRLSHPEATLSELSALMDLGKSGVNHRLQRLMKLAKELHEYETE